MCCPGAWQVHSIWQGHATDMHQPFLPRRPPTALCTCCRCFPGAWQVHFIWPNGKGALLTGIEKERPSYERLLSALQGIPGSKASRSWVDRVNPFSGVGQP